MYLVKIARFNHDIVWATIVKFNTDDYVWYLEERKNKESSRIIWIEWKKTLCSVYRMYFKKSAIQIKKATSSATSRYLDKGHQVGTSDFLDD